MKTAQSMEAIGAHAYLLFVYSHQPVLYYMKDVFFQQHFVLKKKHKTVLISLVEKEIFPKQ